MSHNKALDAVLAEAPQPDPVQVREKVDSHRSWKQYFIRLAILVGVTTGVWIFAFVQLNKFYNENKITIMSPIILRSPLQITNRGNSTVDEQPIMLNVPVRHAEASDQPLPAISDKAVTSHNNNVAEIVSTIYQLESSGGVQDSCRLHNRFNGYGYKPGTCYDSHAEVQALVTNWVAKRIHNYDTPTLLCGYNLGFNSDHLSDCVSGEAAYPYYRDFLKLQ